MEVLLRSSSVFKWVPTNIACSGNNSGNRCSHRGHKPPCFCVIRMEGYWRNNVSAEIGEWLSLGEVGWKCWDHRYFCDFCCWFQWRKNLSSDFGQSNSVKLFRQGQMEIYCSCSLSWENKTQGGLGLCFVIGFFSTCILIFL